MNKVLIVDDEKSIRVTLKAFLENADYTAEVAENAQEAKVKLKQEEFDVVITDVIMPRISGMELVEDVRASSPDTQVIIMTGEPTVETAMEAVRAGAYDYIPKPINKDILLKTVGQAAHIKGLSDAKRRLERINQNYQSTLEAMVERRTKALYRAVRNMVSLLSKVVEMRDLYTSGHQRRVGNLAAAMARELGASQEVIDDIRVAGYLHDLGKIVVPSEILSKPAILTPEEMQLVQSHAIYGMRLVKEVELPDIISDMIYEHHERLDGSGYPRGLAGTEIHAEAHFLIVADVVEAMSSHRPYRPAHGIQAALAEIRSNRGRLYQPEVVDACIRLFEEQKYQLDDTMIQVNLTFGLGAAASVDNGVRAK